MARGKADRQLTVGKKLEIIEEAERTGLMAVTAQKYGVKTGQIRDWKKNIDRLRATDPSRLVCASNVQRGHLVFNETYAQYWVGYNKFCSSNTNYDELKDALRMTQKDVVREGINGFGFPSFVNPAATHPLDVPSMEAAFYPPGDDNPFTAQKKDLETVRTQLREFFDSKPFPTKYLYYVTRLDFRKPDPSENDEEEDGEKKTTEVENAEGVAASDPESVENYISFYVAICGNGSVMVPMAVFPPVEEWHWERKKPVKLRHAHSLHRVKREDPNEALQFFAVTWKKFYDEEAKYSDKFAFLLDKNVPAFQAPEFTDGLKQLEGYGKYWTTFQTVRNPLDSSNFDSILSDFVLDEWRSILAMKKSAQPNDYRKCVAFWFYSAWELFAGDNARTAFRSCNMYLEDKASCATEMGDRMV